MTKPVIGPLPGGGGENCSPKAEEIDTNHSRVLREATPTEGMASLEEAAPPTEGMASLEEPRPKEADEERTNHQ